MVAYPSSPHDTLIQPRTHTHTLTVIHNVCISASRREFRKKLQDQIKEDQKKYNPPSSTDEYEDAVMKDKTAKEQDARELAEKASFLKTFKEANKTVSNSTHV